MVEDNFAEDISLTEAPLGPDTNLFEQTGIRENMEIVSITTGNEAQFYDYVQGRELEFFFLLMDYIQ